MIQCRVSLLRLPGEGRGRFPRWAPALRGCNPIDHFENGCSAMTSPKAAPEAFAKSLQFSRHCAQSVNWITSSFADVTEFFGCSIGPPSTNESYEWI
jgi:hypothetical protein